MQSNMAYLLSQSHCGVPEASVEKTWGITPSELHEYNAPQIQYGSSSSSLKTAMAICGHYLASSKPTSYGPESMTIVSSIVR